jgi:hypothetical protein
MSKHQDLIAEFYHLHPGAPCRIHSLEVATFCKAPPSFPSLDSFILSMWFTSVHTSVPCGAGPLYAHPFLVLVHQLLMSFGVQACRVKSPKLYSQ